MYSLGRFIINILIPQILVVSTIVGSLTGTLDDALRLASAKASQAVAAAQDVQADDIIEEVGALAEEKAAEVAEKAKAEEAAKKAAEAESARAEEAAQAEQAAAEAEVAPAEALAEQVVIEQTSAQEPAYTQTYTWTETWTEGSSGAVAQEAPKPDASGVFHFGTVQHKIGDSFAHDNDVANEWQENYFVAHSGSAQGQIISALSKGAKIEVEGVVVTITGSHYGAAGEDYGALRDKVGWDKVCFQTCIDMAGNYVVWYGTAAGAKAASAPAAAPAPAPAPTVVEETVEVYETTTYETTTYETFTYEIDDFDDDFDD